MSEIRCQYCAAPVDPARAADQPEARCRVCGKVAIGIAPSAKSSQKKGPSQVADADQGEQVARKPQWVSMPGATNLPHLNRDLFLDAPAKSNTVVIASVLTAAVIALTVGVWSIWFRSTDDPGVVTIAQQTAPTPQAPVGPTAPPAPTAPTPQAPTAPTPPAPTAPTPPAPTGPTTPPAGANTLASAIDVDPIFNKEVYLNSQLALTKFEEQIVFGKNDRRAALKQAFPSGVMTAGWEFAEMKQWWKDNRPPFVLDFTGLSQETDVKVTLRCPNDRARQYLDGGQVTQQEWMTVDPKITTQLPFTPHWDLDHVREIERGEDVTFEIEVQYRDNSTDKLQHTVLVHPANMVEHGYPNDLGFAGLVDEDHQYIIEILNAINQGSLCKRTGSCASGGGGPEGELIAVFLVWDHLQRRGLRYSSLAGNANPDAQACRSVHESLSAKNANCVDGTVLLCSFLRRMGIESAIVLIPGHAFLAFESSLRGDSLYVETTMLGSPPPKPGEPAFKAAEDLWNELSGKYQSLREFEAKLDPTQKNVFRGFLAAIETGELVYTEQMQTFEKGDPNRKLPSWADAVAQYNADPANGQNILNSLATEYIRVLPIFQARDAKITSIGTDPDVLKKFPLPPAQP